MKQYNSTTCAGLSLEVGVACETTPTRGELSAVSGRRLRSRLARFAAVSRQRGSALEVNEASGPCGESSSVSTRQK